MAYFLKIGTRASPLAICQAKIVASCLEKEGFSIKIIPIITTGDRILSEKLNKIGEKGLFTDDIEKKLREQEIDIAIHSAKDIPAQIDGIFEILAFTKREHITDVLLSRDPNFNKHMFLSSSFRIGTSSTRRIAQFLHLYPHIKIVNIRGNIHTRLEKLKAKLCDALVLAKAGVARANLLKWVVYELPISHFTSPVGQGSIALQVCKTMDKHIKERIKTIINHPETELCILAERAFLKKMQGGCSIPVFAHCVLKKYLEMHAGIFSLQGEQKIAMKMKAERNKPIELGTHIAQQVLDKGGRELLKQIRQNG